MAQNLANRNQNTDDSWKMKAYAIGLIGGSLMGLLSAYLFNRAAEENREEGEAISVSTTTLIGLALSAMSLIRQIAESGRKKQKK